MKKYFYHHHRHPNSLVIIALLIVVVVSLANAVSETISNGSVRITVNNSTYLQLNELYEVYTDEQQWIPALTYNGLTGIANTFNGLGIQWSVSKLSVTTLSCVGTVLFREDEDRPGDDFQSLVVENATLCAAACFNEPKCQSWTFVKSGWTQGSNGPLCYLKSRVPKAISAAWGTSGTRSMIQIYRNITLQLADGSIVINQTISNNVDQIHLQSLEDWYTFGPDAVDFAFSQSIKRRPDDIIPHWQFKSPAIILQSGPVLTSIIPDVVALNGPILKRQPVFLDLENDASNKARMSFGIGPSYITSHCIWTRNKKEPLVWDTMSTLTMNYYLIISGQEQYETVKNQPVSLGFRTISRWLWSKFGHFKLLASADAQTNFANKTLNLFDTWRKDTWERYAQETYFEFFCGDQLCSSLRSGRALWSNHHGTTNDMWMNSWFQTVRTAFGMYRYGESIENKRIMQQARGVVTLALQAPQNKGAFPTIFWLEDPAGTPIMNWNLDSGWAGLCRVDPHQNIPANCQQFYHSFDMAWTGYWLLRWLEMSPDDNILKFTMNLGQFFLNNQKPSGVVPSWYSKDTLQPDRHFRDLNAETAGVATFMAQLFLVTKNREYLSAAERAMKFIEETIIPSRRWFDYETFTSCSGKSFSFYDGYTRQFPENNLSKFQAAYAYLLLYKSTNDQKYLELGTRIVDYTSLTQQVHSHPLLTPNLLGGFTTQNTDAEWSDARQAYAADMFFDYYNITGNLEYLERGVAALRSSFAVSPFENWSHCGGDVHGAMTGIHWNQGSGTASVEIYRTYLQDAYIHAARNHAVGVNGCTLSDLDTSHPDHIRFTITTPYKWTNPLVVVIDTKGWYSGTDISVTVNDQSVGTFSPDTLLNGLPIDPKYFQE
jgi:hypothetical protein